jgi:ABC-type branched-subunit amino acid transport system substrate-binding protein
MTVMRALALGCVGVFLVTSMMGCETSSEDVSTNDGTAITELKVGGPIQDNYKKAFNLWAGTNNDKYTIKTSFKTYAPATLAEDVASMTDSSLDSYVHVLVCPYGSTAVKNCASAVHSSYAGVILAWGGAADDIFSGSCAGKNCFGFFAVASTYTDTGLAKIDADSSSTASVALIVNNNSFSRSVAAGTKATITAAAGLRLLSETQISVAKTALTPADKALISTAVNSNPDVVVIVGHNKDVEPAIVHIGNGSTYPQVILATNGLTQLEYYGAHSNFAECVMMPTQWDEDSTSQDPVVGWSVSTYKAAMGGSPTYQEAAASASMVAIANAMDASNNDPSQLVAKMKVMDINSFYGKLKWDANGVIQKPMYTVQKQGSIRPIVAPTGVNVRSPLSSTLCWGT